MRRLGVLLGTAAVAAMCALAPSTALAYSSGQFTKAVATEDWTHGSFAASVNAAPCGAGYCSYFPIVFAQPNLPSYSCRSEEFVSSDRNIQQVWTGPRMSANGSLEATATNVPILHGVYGQRYCLELIGEREVPAVICEAEQSEFPGMECPPIKRTFGEYVTGAVMTVELPAPQPAPTDLPPPVAAATPPTTSPICAQGEIAIAKAWKRVTKARKALLKAKRHHRPTKTKRQAWQRDKKEAEQTEQQQHELCG